MEKIKTEPEIVSLFGSEYEKVPRFFYVNEAGEEVVHPAFHDPTEGEIDAFYVRQPLMLSFCRLRTAGAAELPRCESALVPRFRLELPRGDAGSGGCVHPLYGRKLHATG